MSFSFLNFILKFVINEDICLYSCLIGSFKELIKISFYIRNDVKYL